jgi:DNA primase
VPLVEFALRATLEGFDLNTAEGRFGALQATAPLVAGIKERVLRDEYARRVSGWLGFDSPEPVQSAVRERLGEAAPTPGQRPRPREHRVDDVAVDREREALKAALQRPGLAGPAFDALEPVHFTFPLHRELHGAIIAAGGVRSATDVGAWIARVATFVESDEAKRLVPALAVEPLRWEGDGEERYIASVLDLVQEQHTTRRIREVKARMERTNPVTEQEVHLRLFGELIALEQHKRQLRERSLGPA